MENKNLSFCDIKPVSRFYILFISVLLILGSCTTTKQSEYFKTLQQKDTTLKGVVRPDFESKIIKGDRISVTVNSLSSTEDLIFNGPGGGMPTGGSPATGGYLVRPDGTIFLHRIGNMSVEGLTRREMAQRVEEKLLPYMKDPIVQVQFLNHKVTVLGAVGKSQIVDMPGEQISLIEALVQSGDITENGKRNNITVIRDEGNDKKVKHINLEDNSIFTSEWYYLRPNDIVLVSADTQKATKEENRAKLQTTLALVGSGISFLLIILDRVIK